MCRLVGPDIPSAESLPVARRRPGKAARLPAAQPAPASLRATEFRKGFQAGVGPLILAAVARQQQDSRHLRAVEQLGQELGTIQIAPLQVVDPEDSRPDFPQLLEQVPQPAECTTPNSRGLFGRALRILKRNAIDSTQMQHRKHQRKRSDITRQNPAHELDRPADQVPAKGNPPGCRLP